MIVLLTRRQEEILRLIIQNYTTEGQPVGSKKLMEDGIEASSATIRNEMKLLEDLGFLSKTHSSSGRMPSIKGYRYYVDYLLSPVQANSQDVQWIRESLNDEFHEINEIIQESANILSTLTSYTALSIGPDINERRLTGFKVLPLNHRQIIAVIVTDRGNVESRVFKIPREMDAQDIEKMVTIVNERFVGEPLLTVYHRLRTEIPMILHRYFQVTDGILDLFDQMLGSIFEEKIFVGGRMNLLNFEKKQNVNQFKSIYTFMKNPEELNQLLVPKDTSIHIRIGSELENELLENMSLIQANYEIQGHGSGTIALLGPTDMPYSKMFGLIDAFRIELSQRLGEYYQSLE